MTDGESAIIFMLIIITALLDSVMSRVNIYIEDFMHDKLVKSDQKLVVI